jgi:hypothetical protein
MQSGLKVSYPKILFRIKGNVRFKLASEYAERCHTVVSCALNMEDLISKNFCQFSK